MGPNWTYFLILGVLLLVLFGGRGKISALMGDMAKGITAFRKGLKDDEKAEGEASESAREALGSDAASPSETRREDERAGG